MPPSESLSRAANPLAPPLAALPPWRPLLRGAREREGKRSPQNRWLQLATVAADGTPRVRTLVFRGWAGGAALDLLTDGRAAKAEELARQPAVELCWLLPRARCQFRLRGELARLPLADDREERERHWERLTPGGRALWGWPEPGAPRTPDAVVPEVWPEGTPLPDHFQLLRIALVRVELLELLGHPHRRRRWRRETDWAEELLNP
jgi:pyridoxamine 5'-phosphate oxidase